MKREKRTWDVKLTIVDKSLGPNSFYPKCYTKAKIEAFVRDVLNDFDFPNVKAKNVIASERESDGRPQVD